MIWAIAALAGAAVVCLLAAIWIDAAHSAMRLGVTGIVLGFVAIGLFLLPEADHD